MSYVIKVDDSYVRDDMALVTERRNALQFPNPEEAKLFLWRWPSARVVRLVPKALYIVTLKDEYCALAWKRRECEALYMSRDLARAIAKFWGGKVVKVK